MGKQFDNQNFFLTYVKSAEALIDRLEVSSADDLKFRDNVFTIVKAYPAMVNAARELNELYGYKIELPKSDPEEDFDKVEEFYALFLKVSDAVNQDIRFANTLELYDVSSDDLTDKLFKTGIYLSKNIDVSKKYWFKNSLMLSQILTSEIQKDESWKIRVRVSEDQIAEKLLDSMIQNGVKVDERLIEDVQGALSDAGERLAVMNTRPSKNVVLRELMKHLKNDCQLDNRDKRIASSVEAVMDKYTGIVKKSRPTILKHKENFIQLSLAMKSVSEVIPHEAMIRNIKHRRINQELGISNINFNLPKSYKIDEIFVPIISEEQIAAAERPLNAAEQKWDDYKSAKIDDPLIKKGMKTLVSNWANTALFDINSYSCTLQDLDSGDDNDDDEDESDDFKNSFNSYNDGGYQSNSQEAAEDREIIIQYAKELVNLGKASKKYLNLILNDSPVTEKVIGRIENSPKWNDFEFNALNMLFKNMDDNGIVKGGIILSDTGKISEDFVDAALELPSSLEKRELLMTMKNGLARMETDRTERKTDCEDELVDLLSEEHSDAYDKLKEYLLLGSDVYEDIDEDVAASLTQDINVGACLEYVVPIYDDKKEDENAFALMLDKVIDYEDLSAPTQKFVRGLSKKYIETLSTLHNKKLDEGNFSRDIYSKLEDYHEKTDSLNEASTFLMLTVDVLSSENHIYEKYLKFQENSKAKQKHLQFLNALKNEKFCKN